MRISLLPPITSITAPALLIASLFSPHVVADPGSQDATCFPLYRKTGAIPGTGLQCELEAATANVGLGNRFCTSSTTIIERYCGVVMVPDSCPSANVGNPIDSSIGNKRQSENDYVGTGLFPLRLTRHFNSNTAHAMAGSFGQLWRMNYDSSVTLVSSSFTYVSRPDGKIYYFVPSGAAWVAKSTTVRDKLVQQKDGSGLTIGWLYTNSADDAKEEYDAAGRLMKITARNGQTQTLTRSTADTPKTIAPKAGMLIGVTDHFGRRLSFTYNSNETIATVTDPGNAVYRYRYDAERRLTKLEYPVVDTNIQAKTYLYNELEHTSAQVTTNLLTGIQDEKGVRFATYDYDAEGRGIATQHANGVERFGLAYGNDQTIVTDPLGSERTYSFRRVAGALRLTGVSQPGGAGCAAAANAITYDANGNLKTFTDFNGVTTSYVFDLARNLETQRTEASGTAEERIISTEWHPTFRLPARIAEPKRMTTFAYFANGNLQSKTLYTTTDLTGAQGFAATRSTASLKSSYTYDATGRMLTSSTPSVDGMPPAKDTYVWTDGNLTSITNAVGHVTTFSNHDAHGRPGTMLEPNGVSTTYSYSPRGWLLAEVRSAGGQSRRTDYSYDAAGLLQTVTLADGSVITYGYDDAQRLTSITDSSGNKITYALDPAGNRISERVTDPGGALARQTTRIFDALNRLQSSTGDIQ